MQNIIRIGTIWRLNGKYSSEYEYAIVSYDAETKETIVELWSNWSTSYNKTLTFKHKEPLEVVKDFQKQHNK